MPRISAMIPEEMLENLTKLSVKFNLSISDIIRKAIELGMPLYENNNYFYKKSAEKSHSQVSDFELKNREYLLRILNINAEILRRVSGEPSKLPGKNTDFVLDKIKELAANMSESNR